MVKPLLFLSLFCCAFGASLLGYTGEHKYSYKFNGQIASSLSNGQDYSTIRIKSDVNLESLNSNTAVVTLQNPEIGSKNEFLDEPERLHSFQKFEQLVIKPEHASQLVLPFEIQYVDGKIADIKFHSQDSVWSENIKRSMVNLLQVQSKETTYHNYPSIFYKINETTIEGECEVAYHVQKIDSGVENKRKMNMTKTIDFKKCQHRPELRYNYYRHSEPVDWNSDKSEPQPAEMKKAAIQPIVDSISQYDMSIENEIIQNSMVFSKYSYDMVDKDHVSLVTYVLGELTFKTSEKQQDIENSFPKKPAQTLSHSEEFDLMRERFILEGNEDYLKQNPYLKLDNAVDVVKNIMRRLIKSSIDKDGPEGIEEDSNRQFAHLVTMLRLCSRNDIQQIHEVLFKNSDYKGKIEQFVKEILADALAVAGAKNTIDHLVEKIEKEEISPAKAARVLEKLYKLRLTSEPMVKQIFKLCDSQVSRNNENLKRSCYLAYGAMVNAMCGHKHEHVHERWAVGDTLCQPALKQQFIQDAMQLFQQSNLKSEKILALKTLGNMGIDLSIEQLAKIIMDRTEDRIVRIHAIDALRNLRDQVPQQIQRVLTPIYRDRREQPEIRMNAFQELLQTRPDSALLHLLCAEMGHETNNDVKAFVISSIKQMAKYADNTFDEKTSSNLKSCLRLLEQMDETTTRQSDTETYEFGYFSHPSNWHEFGGLLSYATIFSNDSYLPKEIMASLDLLVNRQFIPNGFQVGMHMQELEQLASRILKNTQAKGFDDIVIRGRRSISDYNPIEMLKSLFTKLQLAARRGSSAEPMLLVYQRHNNLDYSFFLLDEANLPEILKRFVLEGHLDVNALEETSPPIRTNDAAYNFESQIKLPTTIGIPMIITSRMTTIGFVDGKYSFSFGNTEKVRDGKIELDVYPHVATSVLIKMECFSPLFTSGVQTIHSLQGRLPIKMEAEMKYPNVIPTISWHLPEQETRLLHFQSSPSTFVRVWPQRSNVFIEPKEKTLLIPELDRLYSTNDYEVKSPITGMRFGVQSHGYRLPFSNYDWILSGENVFELRLKPTTNTAKIVRISGQQMSLQDSQTTKKLEDIFTKQPILFKKEYGVDALKEYVQKSNTEITNLKKISLKLETEGDSDDNSISVDLKAASDNRGSLYVFENDVKVKGNGDVWKWKTLGQLALPELDGVYAPVKSGHVLGQIESSWGARGSNTVIMNLYGKPSEASVEHFKSLLNKNVDGNKKYTREEMLDEKFEKLPSKLKPNSYAAAIEYQVTEETLETVVPMYNWVKTCPKVTLFDLTRNSPAISRQHGTMMAHVVVDSMVNLTIITQTERLQMLNWATEPRRQPKSRSFVDAFASNHEDYASCLYKREEIDTFDGQNIDIPLTTCYTLLAKDCGEESDSRFAIIAKKVTKDADDLKVKFITQKKTYELYKDESSNEMVIKVDNEIVSKDEYDLHSIRKIELSELTIYEIKSRHAEVILRFDGQKIAIKISDVYINRQCGICGHMNNDRSDDFLKHDNTRAESSADFHLSYVLRDDEECEPEVVQKLESTLPKSRRRTDVEKDQNGVQKTRDPIQKTIAIEKRSEVCFSTQPINTCPMGYASADSKKDPVEFKCFKRITAEAQRYLRQAVIEFKNEDVDYTEQLDIPTRCVKYE